MTKRLWLYILYCLMMVSDCCVTLTAGDWKVQVTTGADDDMRCLDTVILFAYGDRGFDGPILLGDGADGVFSPGITDEFKVRYISLLCILLSASFPTEDHTIFMTMIVVMSKTFCS